MRGCARFSRLVGAAICLVAVAAGAARSARADGAGVIAVTGTADRAVVAAAMTQAIGPSRRVVDAVGEARGQLAAGAVPVAALAGFRRVRAMIDDGWRAYLRVQIDVAQHTLAAAVAEAEPLVALPGGPELYADATLRLGAVLLARGAAEAPGLLALAIAIDPARPVTLAEFSPDIVDAVEAVRTHPAARQPLRVEAEPAGARITVDGAEVGAAPLALSVASGPHLVVVHAPLHRPQIALVRVDGTAGHAAVRLVLDRDEPAAALAAGAEPGMAAAAEQGLIDASLGLTDLDDMVIAAVDDRRGEPALIVQRCAGQPARCTAAAEVGFGDRAGLAAAAREAWRVVQSAPLREAPSVLGQVRLRVPSAPGCEFCRKPLVLAGAAVIIVGAMVAIAIASGPRPPPVLTVDGHGFGH